MGQQDFLSSVTVQVNAYQVEACGCRELAHSPEMIEQKLLRRLDENDRKCDK